VVILEKNLRPDILYEEITTLLKDRNKLSQMAKNAKSIGITNATERIYEIIKDIMKTKRPVRHKDSKKSPFLYNRQSNIL